MPEEYRGFAAEVVSLADILAPRPDLPAGKSISAFHVGFAHRNGLASTIRCGTDLLSAWQLTLLGSAAVTLWLSKKLVLAVEEALALRGDGPVASFHVGKLSKSLRGRGLPLTEVDQADPGSGPYAAILVENIGQRSDWAAELARLRGMLMPKARLLSVDSAKATEVSRRFLCGGLSDLHQQEVARQVLTSGIAG